MAVINNQNFFMEWIILVKVAAYFVQSFLFKCTNFQTVQKCLQKMATPGRKLLILCIVYAISETQCSMIILPVAL